ncbi:hypothetical protein Tco_1437748 [Tanacetum coccineum]
METMEDTSKAMLVIDGASLLRVIMAEEEQVQTTWLLWHFQTQRAKPNFDDKGCVDTWSSKAMTVKAFRVLTILEPRRVEENLRINGFLENKPMIEGTGPKWLVDIDSLTQSMNYVPVTAGTVSNDSVGTSEENSQDCIVMPIWKDTSYLDSPTKNVDNGEPNC